MPKNDFVSMQSSEELRSTTFTNMLMDDAASLREEDVLLIMVSKAIAFNDTDPVCLPTLTTAELDQLRQKAKDREKDPDQAVVCYERALQRFVIDAIKLGKDTNRYKFFSDNYFGTRRMRIKEGKPTSGGSAERHVSLEMGRKCFLVVAAMTFREPDEYKTSLFLAVAQNDTARVIALLEEIRANRVNIDLNFKISPYRESLLDMAIRQNQEMALALADHGALFRNTTMLQSHGSIADITNNSPTLTITLITSIIHNINTESNKGSLTGWLYKKHSAKIFLNRALESFKEDDVGPLIDAIIKLDQKLDGNVLRYAVRQLKGKCFGGAEAGAAAGGEGGPPTSGTNVIQLLLEHGIDPNKLDKKGRPPLYYSIKQGDADSVQLLLDHGANLKPVVDIGIDVNKHNESGYPPLYYAIKQGHAGYVKILLDLGADTGMMIKDEASDGEEVSLAAFAARQPSNQCLEAIKNHPSTPACRRYML